MKTINKLNCCALLLWLLFPAAFRGFAADDTNAPALDMRSFQIVSERNIFNPNRRPLVSQTIRTPRQPPSDWFILAGTMSYPNQSDRRTYAFFEGSSAQYRQAKEPTESIGGFKITEITSDHVKLTSPDNKVINMRLQTQMRKPAGGSWSLVASVDAPAEPAETVAAAPSTDDDGSGASGGAVPATTSAAAAPAADAGGSEDDVARKMMERRAKEQ